MNHTIAIWVRAASMILAVLAHTLVTGCAGIPKGSTLTVSGSDPAAGVGVQVTATQP